MPGAVRPSAYAYGRRPLVAINAAVFLVFVFSFTRPGAARDRRSFGTFSAFIVALCTEMFGFPLTISLLSGWLRDRFLGRDLFAHNDGMLWWELLGRWGDPHRQPWHQRSILGIAGSPVLLAAAWPVLFRAQRDRTLATTGPYASLRHPQYAAFVPIMVGFLPMWPTLPTVVMFPALLLMYARLIRRQEREARAARSAPPGLCRHHACR